MTDKTEPPATHRYAFHNHGPTAITAPLSWAQRLKRVFNIDITLCRLCGEQHRVIEDVTDPDLIRKILDHRQRVR